MDTACKINSCLSDFFAGSLQISHHIMYTHERLKFVEEPGETYRVYTVVLNPKYPNANEWNHFARKILIPSVVKHWRGAKIQKRRNSSTLRIACRASDYEVCMRNFLDKARKEFSISRSALFAALYCIVLRKLTNLYPDNIKSKNNAIQCLQDVWKMILDYVLFK